MEKQNVVSIWLGTFNSEEDFKKYIEEHYDEEGEMTSSFMKDFEISFYDNQFFEGEFIANPTLTTLIEPLSYSNFFKDQFTNSIGNYNSIIAIYNFEYNKIVTEKSGLKFIKSFTYEI